eukprot:14794516-Ditylum_brightwellii.AAC.1
MKGQSIQPPPQFYYTAEKQMVEPPAPLFPSPSFSTTTTTTSGHIWAHRELLYALSGAQWLWRCNRDAIDKIAKMATPFHHRISPFPLMQTTALG